MSMNKREKYPNTIGTINLSPQFNRPQQGQLYALHATKRKSKQQAEAKQHSKTRTAEARFFKPRFKIADHVYVLLCTKRSEVPSISAVAWSLSSPGNLCATKHVGATSVSTRVGVHRVEERFEAQNRSHQNGQQKTRYVYATRLPSFCGQMLSPNCSWLPAHTQFGRNSHELTRAPPQTHWPENWTHKSETTERNLLSQESLIETLFLRGRNFCKIFNMSSPNPVDRRASERQESLRCQRLPRHTRRTHYR